MKSILRKTSGTFGMIAALTLAAGCAQNGPTDQVPEPSQKSEQLAQPRAKGDAVNKPRADRKGQRFGRRGGGPEMLFRAALDKLELSAEQKTTVEALIADLKKVERPADDTARKELDESLAAAVRAGKVDPASFDGQIAALEKKRTSHASEVHAALDKLHATLTAEQRATLVTELKKKMEAGPGKWARGGKGRRGPGAGAPPSATDDLTAPDDPNAPLDDDLGLDDGVPLGPDLGPGPGMRGPHRGMRGGPMGMMRGLDLTEDQQAKLRESMKAGRPDFQKKGAEMRKRHTQMLDAFASDSFDAAKLFGQSDVQSRMREHAKMRIEHLAKLTAILTPEQREKLAKQLEAGPRKMMKRR